MVHRRKNVRRVQHDVNERRNDDGEKSAGGNGPDGFLVYEWLRKEVISRVIANAKLCFGTGDLRRLRSANVARQCVGVQPGAGAAGSTAGYGEDMSLDHSSGARRTLSTVPTLALTPLLTRTLTLMLVLAGCNLSALDNPYAGRAVTTPVAVSGSRSYSRIAAGFFHSCALTTGGRAYCWGSNEYQQLGTDAPVPQCEQRRCTHAPVAAGAGGTYSEIATGTTTTCAITTSKRAVCWGGSYPLTPPALGDGTTSESATPVFVQTDSLLSAITVGGNHACALTASGAALCWGSNQSGQLGDSSATARGIPVLVLGTLRFRSIAAGGGFTCGITFDGDAYCWGSNRWGQLGIGEVPYNAFGVASIRPRRVESSLKWLAIGVGAEHTCAIAAGGLAYCRGGERECAATR